MVYITREGRTDAELEVARLRHSSKTGFAGERQGELQVSPITYCGEERREVKVASHLTVTLVTLHAKVDLQQSLLSPQLIRPSNLFSTKGSSAREASGAQSANGATVQRSEPGPSARTAHLSHSTLLDVEAEKVNQAFITGSSRQAEEILEPSWNGEFNQQDEAEGFEGEVQTAAYNPDTKLFGDVGPPDSMRSHTHCGSCPFHTQKDFEFAELVSLAGLSTAHTEALIWLMQTLSDSVITFLNAQSLHSKMDSEAKLLTLFTAVPITVRKRIEKYLELSTWIKPMMDWLLELLDNYTPKEHFRFTAERKFRHSDGKSIRFVDEPWTAQDWLELQKLSRFGTKNGYPVIAHLGNLPHHICNGQGVAGGRVVGWIPALPNDIEDLPKSSSKLAKLKCSIWHKAMLTPMETIKDEVRVGYAMQIWLPSSPNTRSRVWRLFPFIFTNKLADMSFQVEVQDSHNVRKPFQQVKDLNRTQANELPKSQSYCPVKNAYWLLKSTTGPFQAFSYDVLHTVDLGCWGDHLWPILKDTERAGPRVPRASTECIYTKVVFHGGLGLSDNFIPLLVITRKQAEIRVLALLTVHTEETVEYGRMLVNLFGQLSKDCTLKYNQSFNFPKMHLLAHLLDNIWTKGVTQNYSTKSSEQMHKYLRRACMASSKESDTVDKAILHQNHCQAVIQLI
ncbi:hypothetical protein BDV93DRAFT_514944 [Ceratobasidium sp. AG-I]|nr:hypothetical protein BDV93DRAFT_514944 [Ceratobasidium sp. AG-I]